MRKDILSHIQSEKETIELMIRLYCKRKEGQDILCPQCTALLKYACERLEKCRFGAEKPACKRCSIHCYKPEMREQIKEVMRYAGPRMIFYSPIATIRHLINI